MQLEKSQSGLRNGHLCPFLGLTDDPGTALSYPSTINRCYHAKPVAPINREHQVNSCLNSNFATCPVYLNNQTEPLPKEFGIGFTSQNKRKRWVRIVSFVGVAAICVLLITLGKAMVANKTLEEKRDNEAQALAIASLTMNSAQILATQTPTPVPTQIESPTATITAPIPTTIPVHQLEMPIGENPSFVIHRIQEGENFIRFSEVYNASREAILAVNYGMDPALWAGAILVIPVGVTDATGLPSFTTLTVTEQNLTIEALTENTGANLELLKQYNALPAGYIFSEGEWVLIPQ